MLGFLGIGAQKAGTTWLYHMLRQHPDIEFPAGKELHFWNQPHGESEVYNYLQQFQHPSLIQGEITPAYAFLPISTIREIYKSVDNLKLIYLIRNPIDRAWSSALMALQRAEMTFEEASDQWFIDHFRSKGSLARGDYEGTIKSWSRIFGQEALLIIRYDHIVDRPVNVLQSCFRHLDVNILTDQQLQGLRYSDRFFKGPGYAIRPSLYPVLRELYVSRIESLESALGLNLISWKD